MDQDHSNYDEQVSSREQLGPLVHSMADEYLQIPFAAPLSVLKEVTVNGKSYTDEINNGLAYLEQTQEVEVDTQRVQQLQGYVDKMLGDEAKGAARVIILNKGKQPKAFSLPDGTICINQAFIQDTETIDDIGAVLAYQVKLIQEKDFEVEIDEKTKWSPTSTTLSPPNPDFPVSLKRGNISRTNEIPNEYHDEITTLLQRTNLDPAPFAGANWQDRQETPTEWKSLLIAPTNAEITTEALSQEPELDVATLKTVFERLCPTDFVPSHYKARPHMMEAFSSVAMERLKNVGYPEAAIKHAILLTAGPALHAGVIKSPEEVVSLAKYMSEPNAHDQINQIYQTINFNAPFAGVSLSGFLEIVEQQAFIVKPDTETDEQTGIPITEDTLLDTLQVIYNAPSTETFGYYTAQQGTMASSLLPRYAVETYLQDGTLDIEGATAFFEKVKAKGIILEPDFCQDFWEEDDSIFLTDVEKESKNAGGFEAINQVMPRFEAIMDVVRNVFHEKSSPLKPEEILLQEVLPPEIRINRYTPSDLRAKDPEALGKLDLTAILGQAIGTSDHARRDEIFKKLFLDEGNGGKEFFIAEEDGRAVGYITLNTIKKPGHGEDVWNSQWGQSFMTDVQAIMQEPALTDTITRSSDSVIAITGVATREDQRKRGIQKKLWQNVITELHPGIIIGDSKSPRAVMSRSSAFGVGYKTYFGKTEITPGVDQSDTASEDPSVRALRIATLNFYASELEEPDRNDRLLAHRAGIISMPPDVADNDVPDVSNFPPSIQRAFASLIEQQSKHLDKLLMLPMVSIKDGFVDADTSPESEDSSSTEKPAPTRTRPPEN